MMTNRERLIEELVILEVSAYRCRSYYLKGYYAYEPENFRIELSDFFQEFTEGQLTKLITLKNFKVNSTGENQKIKRPQIKKKTYLMKDLNTGLYKIGRSSNPAARESTLQSEKPTIKMVKVWEEDIEKELHRMYEKERVRGEWFNLSEIQVKFITSKP